MPSTNVLPGCWPSTCSARSCIKDGLRSIIAAAFASDDALGAFLYAAGLVGALLTGLYTFRLYFAVFRGEPSELDALVAYLQMLGTLVDFSTYEAADLPNQR